MQNIVTFLLTLLLVLPFGNLRAENVLVFAASSLQTALDEIAENWQSQTEHEIAISYGGSGQLARQITLGAPADIFISAAPNWMDAAEAEDVIKIETRRDLLGNELVLIAHDKSYPEIQINNTIDFPALLNESSLAIASVDAVPAGQYAKEALTYYDAWENLKSTTIQTDNVRSALALVARGEADFGIVYQSDAKAEPKVKTIGHFPETSHEKILYPIALTQASNDAAQEFYDYLFTQPAKEVFQSQGFSTVENQ